MNTPAGSPILAIYLDRRGALRRLLVARLGNPEDAEDVLQDLYFKVSRMQADDIQDPVSYLYRMALNIARDHRRTARRSIARDAGWADVHHQLAGSQAVDELPSAEDAVAAKQRLVAVHAALEDLSPQCRRVFILHKFEGFSHQETAQRTGITRSTVEKHMHTALKHLMLKLRD